MSGEGPASTSFIAAEDMAAVAKPRHGAEE
jgi:hypothetical protein